MSAWVLAAVIVAPLLAVGIAWVVDRLWRWLEERR